MNHYGTPDGSGRFVENLVHFARILRSAGLPVGTGRILDAVRAVNLAGVSNREDFYWTLHAVFVNHPRQRMIFNQAFHVFWKNPRMLERSISMLLPQVRIPENEKSSQELARRLTELLYPQKIKDAQALEPDPEFELRASLTYSDRERLQKTDFESMSIEESEQAKKAVAKMRVAFSMIPMRRYQINNAGSKLDLRESLKKSLRGTADTIALVRSKRKIRTTPVVVLCDISGSMSEYSRMILQFAHVLMMCRNDVSCFVFGTRLTNITRQMRVRDVDCALGEISESVEDWYGGTRIGDCLKDFNRLWTRRLPMHSATVLLVTDGLDRSESGSLGPQISLLHRSCRQLIWLNPLLRYDQFEPKVSGVRAMLPHVDAFLPVHNLDSLSSLADALGHDFSRGDVDLRRQRTYWRFRMRDSESPSRMNLMNAVVS